MKTLFLSIALTLSLISFAQDAPKKNLAEVNQYSGVYVFIDCKPVREYEFIATMKKAVAVNSAMEAIKKYAAMAKKEYPDCDAIIFHDVVMSLSKDQFDVIKFK